MKKIVLSICCALLGNMMLSAQKTIQLPPTAIPTNVTLMKALSHRQSVREFSTKDISLQELSNLLWAANGINRKNGKRTAPSALNAQDIDIYVCRADGGYLYEPQSNTLKQITGKDLRNEVAGSQDFVKNAPVCLVLVSNEAKFTKGGGEKWEGVDAGYVSQNICLYCSATNLATVPRGSMNTAALKKELKLTDKQTPWINHPVGYNKK
ncbi:SagB/ThcOx family dehydrogenase [Bacteroides acidifaciens]|uniref:nitroreductase family protein n=1 Tax=Bacteroides acidifaciens TaxID=85831 RepID=UPI00258261D0|nr:SagB/ThcOx family dehydrogenase [Bacteroides acidifaciens]